MTEAFKMAEVDLFAISPYSQSRCHQEEKLDKELEDDYAQRTWQAFLHTEGDNIVIPQMALANSIKDAAQYLGEKIPGRGNNTWTKHFDAGISVLESPHLFDRSESPITVNDAEREALFLNSDGKRGGGRRVWRYYPRIDDWKCTARYVILDPIITEEVFRRVLTIAGQLIGIGRFRPRNRGHYGRYGVESIKFGEGSLEELANVS